MLFKDQDVLQTLHVFKISCGKVTASRPFLPFQRFWTCCSIQTDNNRCYAYKRILLSFVGHALSQFSHFFPSIASTQKRNHPKARKRKKEKAAPFYSYALRTEEGKKCFPLFIQQSQSESSTSATRTRKGNKKTAHNYSFTLPGFSLLTLLLMYNVPRSREEKSFPKIKMRPTTEETKRGRGWGSDGCKYWLRL